MIPPDVSAEIVRLYHAEKWPVGTIAAQLGLHHSSVSRVLQQQGVVRAQAVRPMMIDDYLPFIIETFKKYPNLTASRLYAMVRQRGYPGRPDHFRHMVRRYRPLKPAEAYLRVRCLPGEQGQVDWGHFGKLIVGRAHRPLMAFVMVLSYSRMTFLRFYLNAQMPNFLRGHVDAFEHFDGVPRVLLYDNLKSVVLERQGNIIRFNPKILELKSHYHFEPRPVAPARGNEKGRVERKIRHIRQNFFPARSFQNLADLNEQALEWCMGEAAERPCPEDPQRSVREVYEQEQSQLLPLAEHSFDADEQLTIVARKQPYVRFDLNDYTIPHDRVRRSLQVRATLCRVRIFDGDEEIADHIRSFDKGAEVEESEHVEGLRTHKRRAKARSKLDHLRRAAPSVVDLLTEAAQHQQSLQTTVARLNSLLDAYGGEMLEKAICEAIELGTPHVGAVHQILETTRDATGQPPPVLGGITDDPRTRNITVKPHALETYDQLSEENDD